MKINIFFKLFGIYVVLLPILCFLLFPFFWILSTSFKNPSEIYALKPCLIPKSPTGDNYVYLWYRTNFSRYFINSLIVSLGNAFLTVLIGTLAAYGLSRSSFKGKDIVIVWLISSQMLPLVLLVIPLFIILLHIHLLNSLLGLIIIYCAFSLPFSTLMLKGYFDSIPRDLDEAALVDGCSRLGAAFRIVFPLAAPGVIATALFAFVLAWQDYLLALTFTQTDELRTLAVGITYFLGFRQVQWGPITAASVLTTLPVAIFFIYLQKYLVQGMTLGGVK
jgi:ABC-type glycerol-3-phosphate transport system permease component